MEGRGSEIITRFEIQYHKTELKLTKFLQYIE